MAVHAFLWLLFLLNFSWTALIINTPLLGWNVYKSAPLLSFFVSSCSAFAFKRQSSELIATVLSRY